MNIRTPAVGLAIATAASLTGCYSDEAAFSSSAGNYGLPPGASGPSPWNGTGGTGGAAGMPAPPSNAGDRYTAPGTNPFVLTEHDPFSTFAVDVDTASYDIFRRDVNLNVLPQPASVRLEEYVNSFSYDYPAPAESDEAPFRISVAASGQVFDRPSVLLRVGIQGKKPPPFQKRPANLVFLVDVSGSMDAPNKLPLVRTVLDERLESPRAHRQGLHRHLRRRHAACGWPRPPWPASRQTIEAVISGSAGGRQHRRRQRPAAGLRAGRTQAFIPEGINHILLCTDGDFNVGPSSTKELVNIVREKRQGGVTLTVLGFGVGNLNDDLMEAVANTGNGIYGVISDETYARRYVQREDAVHARAHRQGHEDPGRVQSPDGARLPAARVRKPGHRRSGLPQRRHRRRRDRGRTSGDRALRGGSRGSVDPDTGGRTDGPARGHRATCPGRSIPATWSWSRCAGRG